MRLLPLLALLVASCAHVGPPGPEPTPTPEPPPGVTCKVWAEDIWTETLIGDDQLEAVVAQAQTAVGDVCGQPLTDSLCRIAAELEKAGHLTGLSGQAVYVRREDGLFERHDAVAGAPHCWAVGTWRGVWAKADE